MNVHGHLHRWAPSGYSTHQRGGRADAVSTAVVDDLVSICVFSRRHRVRVASAPLSSSSADKRPRATHRKRAAVGRRCQDLRPRRVFRREPALVRHAQAVAVDGGGDAGRWAAAGADEADGGGRTAATAAGGDAVLAPVPARPDGGSASATGAGGELESAWGVEAGGAADEALASPVGSAWGGRGASATAGGGAAAVRRSSASALFRYPVGEAPRDCCQSRIAAGVRGPKRPSGVPGSKPSLRSPC